jgi:hypothetical protein
LEEWKKERFVEKWEGWDNILKKQSEYCYQRNSAVVIGAQKIPSCKRDWQCFRGSQRLPRTAIAEPRSQNWLAYFNQVFMLPDGRIVIQGQGHCSTKRRKIPSLLVGELLFLSY